MSARIRSSCGFGFVLLLVTCSCGSSSSERRAGGGSGGATNTGGDAGGPAETVGGGGQGGGPNGGAGSSAVRTLMLTSPNGGENWELGSAHTITWDFVGDVTRVAIEIAVPDSWSAPIIAETDNTGSFPWVVPILRQPPTGNEFVIRIADLDDPDVTDESDAAFSITGGADTGWIPSQVGDAHPAARWGSAMAYAGGSRAVLFGGIDDSEEGSMDDTWEYDSSVQAWTEISVTGPHPPARANHAMAYGGGSDVYLFGGYAGDDSSEYLADLWVYDADAHTWTELSPGGDAPPARAWHAMARATSANGEDRLVLFGGTVLQNRLGDTWELDLASMSWTNPAQSTGAPPALYGHAMAHAGGSKVVLLGGYYLDATYVWEYDVDTHEWTELVTAGAALAPRYDHAAAFAGGRRVLSYGGRALLDIVGETWLCDAGNSTWTALESSGATPGPRAGHVMAHAGGSTVVLFGGGAEDPDTLLGHVAFGDTWVQELP